MATWLMFKTDQGDFARFVAKDGRSVGPRKRIISLGAPGSGNAELTIDNLGVVQVHKVTAWGTGLAVAVALGFTKDPQFTGGIDAEFDHEISEKKPALAPKVAPLDDKTAASPVPRFAEEIPAGASLPDIQDSPEVPATGTDPAKVAGEVAAPWFDRAAGAVEGLVFATNKAAVFDFGANETEGLVDLLLAVDAMKKATEGLDKMLGAILERTKKVVIDRWVEAGQDSATKRGKTVYIAREYWPGPRYRDLLPPGVEESNPDYAATVAKCQEAGKDRLVQALKASANFSHLIVEKYETQSLRGAFAGQDVERDSLDVPLLPPEFEGKVELNPRTVIRVRKSTR